MVRKIALVALIGVLTLGLSGCVLRRAEESEKRTESRNVSGFDAVDFDGWGDLSIEQGNEYELTISGAGDVLDRIRTEVRGDTLHVYLEPRMDFWFLGWNERRIELSLTVPELTALEVDGAGRVRLDGIETDSLDLDLAGASELRVDDIDVEEFILGMSGAGSAEVSGKAPTQVIVISGAGEFDGADLEGRDVDVTMSGAGNATVWATRTLNVDASGAGSVKYYGDPDVDSELSGAGSVHDLGHK